MDPASDELSVFRPNRQNQHESEDNHMPHVTDRFQRFLSPENTGFPSHHQTHVSLVPVEERYHLGTFSTSSLILNKMIGTGIFVGPSVVLAATGSKGMSLILWSVGCIMTWAGLLVYLEYGIRWPVTGGELYYIHYVYARPQLLFTYLFSVLFVLLGGVQANALAFGKQVILASSPRGANVDPRLQKVFAILIVTFVCQLQAYSRTTNVRVNNALGAFKICLLSFIAITGWVAIAGVRSRAAAEVGSEYGKENLTNIFTTTSAQWYGYSLALLNIVRAFLGYENANFVLEEVRRPKDDEHRIFRQAVTISVAIVCFLYLMVNVAFFAACTSEDILKSPETLALFFEKVFGPSDQAHRASAIIIALSAAGAIMSLTFANVRAFKVKQEIARLGVIPMPEYWARTSNRLTPAPALLLHWIFSVLIVLLTPLSNPDGFLIVSTLYSYAHTWINVLLGCGVLCGPFLASFKYSSDRSWKPKSSKLGYHQLIPLTIIYVLANMFIIILSWYPADVQHLLGSKAHTLPSFTGPIIGTSIFGGGALYWAWDVHILKHLGYKFSREERTLPDGTVDINFDRNLDGVADQVAGCLARLVRWYRKHFRGPEAHHE